MAFSYGVVAYHFWSELLYYRSMRFGRASLTTLIVARQSRITTESFVDAI